MLSHQEDPFIIVKSYNNQALVAQIQQSKERKPTIHSWTQVQSFVYLNFLKQNLLVMESKQHRKASRIFKKLEKAIKTRSSAQIKSHHQKLMKKHGYVKMIICTLESSFTKKSRRILALLAKEAQTQTDIKFDSKEQISGQNYSPSCIGEDISQRSQQQQIFFEQSVQQYIRIPCQNDEWNFGPLI